MSRPITDRIHYFDDRMIQLGINVAERFNDEERSACRTACDDAFDLGRDHILNNPTIEGKTIGPLSRDNWKHRTAKMTCINCMKYIPKKVNIDTGLCFGRCRAHAPTRDGWPAVFGNDFCYDHKLDENRI